MDLYGYGYMQIDFRWYWTLVKKKKERIIINKSLLDYGKTDAALLSTYVTYQFSQNPFHLREANCVIGLGYFVKNHPTISNFYYVIKPKKKKTGNPKIYTV